MQTPKLEELAKEVESVFRGKDEKKESYDQSSKEMLLSHIRNDEYPRPNLVKELMENQLSWFAKKLMENYYDVK